ncbi:MAG: hypothetical protein PHN42_00260 [Bacilli bacterium]|nr:hypothetical protein [Bacilli bacterium]
MSAEETLNIISKQWCDLKDIMQLAQIGRNSALKIKSEISNKLIDEGYFIPKQFVPMKEVVNYLKIDIEYLRDMTLEKRFGM